MIKFQSLNIYQKLTFICVNIQAFVSLLGIICNILVICVLRRKPLKKYSYSFYWRINAYSDIFILLHSFRNWANSVLDFDLSLVSTFFCKINEYQPYVVSYISLSLVFLISFDRLIAIVYPKRFKILNKRWFQICLVLIMIIYSLLVNIQLPLYFGLEERNVTFNNSSLKIYVCYLPPEILNDISYIGFIHIFLLNVVITNILQLKLVHFLYTSRGNRASASSIQMRSSIRNRKVAFSTIGLNISCCFFKMFFVFGIYIATVYEFNADQFKLIYTISVTVTVIDNCDLFFINMYFNSMFYEEFFKMVS